MIKTPVSKFGKDHWSMLGYIETCCVDGRGGIGTLDKRRMKCNEKTHSLHAVNSHSVASWKESNGTRLAGYFDFPRRSFVDEAISAGFLLPDHDDWDCMNDLEAAGFVEVISEANGHVRMTKEGSRVSGLLREHKSNGGMFAGFVLEDTMATA